MKHMNMKLTIEEKAVYLKLRGWHCIMVKSRSRKTIWQRWIHPSFDAEIDIRSHWKKYGTRQAYEIAISE